MAIQSGDYEHLLARCSDYQGALAMLKQHRPYLEMLPSMRRPQESIVTIPLPNLSIRRAVDSSSAGPVSKRREVVSLPCDVVILMCDPEWKIKTGVDVVLFIHRPDEDFSELLLSVEFTIRVCSSTAANFNMSTKITNLKKIQMCAK